MLSLRKLPSARPERGAALLEYGLLAVLIAIVAMAAIQLAGVEVAGLFDSIATELTNT